MNRSLLPRLLALGLVVLVAAAVAPVATAQTPADDCPGAGTSVVTGNIDDPDEGQVVPAKSTTIRGCFEYGSDVVGPLGTINKVTISLVAGRGQVLPAGASNVVLFDGPPVRAYRFAWTTPALAWNGPYTVRVVVEGSARPPGGRQPNVTAERRFLMETAPAPPTDVKAVPEGEEGVTVTWDKNKEPDIVLYEVHRAPRDGDFIPVAQTAANLTTLNDRPSVGDWRYVVIAVRRGAGDDGIASGPSKEAEAAVVVPPAPSTTTTAPGGAGGAGQPPPTTLQRSGSGIVITSATTGAGGAARPAGGGGKVDLSRFGSLGRSTTRQIDAPDPGFEEELPFAPGDQPTVAEDETQELGADDPNRDRAVGQGLISDESERRRSLTFVAFGLLLFVMSMGGLWMRGEVKRADELEALEPTPARPPKTGPPAPPPTLPGPLPGPYPSSNGGPAPASAGAAVYAPPPSTRRLKPAPPTPPQRLRRPETAATPPSPEHSSEPVPAAPAPAVAVAAGAAGATSGHADGRSARRAARHADPLAGMTPLSPPPPRPWSARQPLDAPALDVPDPEPEPEPVRESPAARRARRSERRLPVR